MMEMSWWNVAHLEKNGPAALGIQAIHTGLQSTSSILIREKCRRMEIRLTVPS